MANSLEGLAGLRADILYVCALEMAHQGNYAEAERLLQDLGENLTAEHLLLWGKIYAQQGKYDRAIELWEQALSLKPGHREAAQAVARAREIMAAPRLPRRQKAGLALVVAGLAVALAFTGNALFHARQDYVSLQAEKTKLVQQVARAEREREQAAAAALVVQAEMLEKALTRDSEGGFWGVKVGVTGSTFFLEGQVPTEHCREVLRQAAQQLAPGQKIDATGIRVTHRYQVQAGDSLSRIARRVYGDAARASDIARANATNVGPAGTIYPDTWLLIPE